MTRLTINPNHLKTDIFTGIIIALVSIPISMGYAQIASLPPVYGLYGSLLPILVFALITSSPQFIVGVDAMPAAMMGSCLSSLGVTNDSSLALLIVPSVTLLISIWFILFRILKAGRIVKYISNPVMGGFISGVGLTIILMQVPKLFGAFPGTGEVVSLVKNIVLQLKNFNLLSFVLGLGTIITILVSKKIAPKFPMTLIMLLLGIVLTVFFKVQNYGVQLLPAVQKSLPQFKFPPLYILREHFMEYLVLSFSISLVIMAQSLLTSKSYASKNGYSINVNTELLAYSAMNLSGSLCGTCPINGSVSRTGMADQFGSRSQIVSITSFITMLIVVLFCTQYFVFLPVPVLTGIVISALIGIVDYKQAIRLWKSDKTELMIFITACLGVLLFGTIWGVLIGVLLSFFTVVRRAVVPPRSFLGLIPGHQDFYNLNRNKAALPLCNTIIYSFRGNLFFANIDIFENDILNSIKEDTKQVIVDAHGIGSIDITASDRLVKLYESLKSRNISFYLTEHAGTINDQLRRYGAECLINQGAVRRTVSLALRDCGLTRPYPLQGAKNNQITEIVEADERLAEFEWAFGKEAEQKMKDMAHEMADTIAVIENKEEILSVDLEKVEEKVKWGKIGLFDEEELLDRFEIHLEHLEEKGKLTHETFDLLDKKIRERKKLVEQKVSLLNPHATELLKTRHRILEEHLKQTSPKDYERLVKLKNFLNNQE